MFECRHFMGEWVSRRLPTAFLYQPSVVTTAFHIATCHDALAALAGPHANGSAGGHLIVMKCENAALARWRRRVAPSARERGFS